MGKFFMMIPISISYLAMCHKAVYVINDTGILRTHWKILIIRIKYSTRNAVKHEILMLDFIKSHTVMM